MQAALPKSVVTWKQFREELIVKHALNTQKKSDIECSAEDNANTGTAAEAIDHKP